MRIKLCAIAKNEGPYLARWIHHHLYFGFRDILIYINDCTDNSEKILNKISNINPSIKFLNADKMRVDSLSKGRSFQVDAFNHMYNSAKDEGFEYIIFLDIDEYWTPRDFTTKIYDFIDEYKTTNFDAYSFSWMIDFPDKNVPPLQNPIKGLIKILRNYHVKTLLKISDRVEKISVHNHVVKNGIYLLDDGVPFEETDPIEQHKKSKVLHDYFEKNLDKIPKYFIYHALFRSQSEYLVSLINKGSLHTSDQPIFKKNRWGFVFDNNKPVINFSVKMDIIAKYYSSYKEFISNNSIINELHDAEIYFYKRYFFATEIISKNKLEVENNAKLFNGLTIMDDIFYG